MSDYVAVYPVRFVPYSVPYVGQSSQAGKRSSRPWDGTAPAVAFPTLGRTRELPGRERATGGRRFRLPGRPASGRARLWVGSGMRAPAFVRLRPSQSVRQA